MGCVEDEITNDQDLALQDFDNDNNLEYLGKADETVDKYERPDVESSFDMFEVAEESGGEEFMAVKPWMGALVEPSEKPEFNRGPPSAALEVSFVNGYRTEDTRSNLFFLNESTIVYPAACLGVRQDLGSRNQTFYGGGPARANQKHNDDIISLALSPDKSLVATGSLGARPMVQIWNPNTMETVGQFKLDRNTRCVSVMTFSKDGTHLFLGDKANEHNVYLYAIDGTRVHSTKTGSDNLNDCAAGTDGFATASKDGFLYFDSKELKKKRGLSNGHDIGKLACVSASGNTFYAGDISGNLFVFEGNSCTKSHEAHGRALMAIAAFEDCIVTSGADDKVKCWTKGMECTREVMIDSYCKAIDKLGDCLLLGTRLGEILTVDATNSPKQIMKTHWTGETWGLEVCPKTGLIVTSGDDNLILAFDKGSKSVVSKGIISSVRGRRKRIGGASTLSLLPPNQQCRALAISKKSGNVAVATNTGGLTIRKSARELDDVIFDNLSLAKEWIEVMKYCPAGEKLAVGSHDNNIYILNEGYDTLCVCRKHNSFITNLDWSVDGSKMHSNCGAYEYLFFDTSTGKQLTSGATICKDEPWDTYTVKLGWWVQGIFPPATSGNFINSCSRSHNKQLVMTGDDRGQVNLFCNPALKGAKCQSFKAHSSHVVRSQFSEDDREVFSVGGFDKCLIIWSVR